MDEYKVYERAFAGVEAPARLKEQFGVETMDDVFQQLARHAVRKAD